MKRITRTTMAAIAAAIAFGISACSSAKPEPKPAPPAPAAAAENPAPQPNNDATGRIAFSEVTEAQVPDELREWAQKQQMQESPGSHAVVKGRVTYVAVSGGVKPSGGYQVALSRAFVTTLNGQESFQIDVTISAPPPGSAVTTAMTNPVAFYQVGGLLPVQVTINGETVTVQQEPLAGGPASGENFRNVTARQVDATTVLVEGAARAFEAMFKVQIRSGGQVIASEPVMAAEGGPAYGAFSARIATSVPMPREGVEALFIIPSAKDGSEVPELIIPVMGVK